MATLIQIQLTQSLVLPLLLLDVGADHALIPTDGRHEVAPSPEMLPDTVPRVARILPGMWIALFPLI